MDPGVRVPGMVASPGSSPPADCGAVCPCCSCSRGAGNGGQTGMSRATKLAVRRGSAGAASDGAEVGRWASCEAGKAGAADGSWPGRTGRSEPEEGANGSAGGASVGKATGAAQTRISPGGLYAGSTAGSCAPGAFGLLGPGHGSMTGPGRCASALFTPSEDPAPPRPSGPEGEPWWASWSGRSVRPNQSYSVGKRSAGSHGWASGPPQGAGRRGWSVDASWTRGVSLAESGSVTLCSVRGTGLCACPKLGGGIGGAPELSVSRSCSDPESWPRIRGSVSTVGDRHTAMGVSRSSSTACLSA